MATFIHPAITASVKSLQRTDETKGAKMSNWRPMVNVNGREWAGNGLVFATKQEAEDNARALMARWLLVTDTRADPTDDEVNYRWVDHRLVAVEKPDVQA